MEVDYEVIGIEWICDMHVGPCYSHDALSHLLNASIESEVKRNFRKQPTHPLRHDVVYCHIWVKFVRHPNYSHIETCHPSGLDGYLA